MDLFPGWCLSAFLVGIHHFDRLRLYRRDGGSTDEIDMTSIEVWGSCDHWMYPSLSDTNPSTHVILNSLWDVCIYASEIDLVAVVLTSVSILRTWVLLSRLDVVFTHPMAFSHPWPC